MKFRHCWQRFWKRKWLIVLSTVLVGGAAFVASWNTTPEHRATTRLLASLGSPESSESYASLVAGGCLAQTYARILLESQPVVEETLERLDLIEIENNGYGQQSAIYDLVNWLNDHAGVGTYAFVDPGLSKIGTDGIAGGFLYKPGSITPNSNINADEPRIPNYDEAYNPPYLYSLDQYRSSDHDRVLIDTNPVSRVYVPLVANTLGESSTGAVPDLGGEELEQEATPLTEITFQPTNEDFANPDRGFMRQTSIFPDQPFDPYKITVTEPSDTIVWVYLALHNYRDRLLDEAGLSRIRATFQTARDKGLKLVILSTYNWGPGSTPDPDLASPDAPLDLVLQHIGQLEPILVENADVIVAMQIGFVGHYGEWHSSKYLHPLESRRAIVDALLNTLPKERMLQIRYPRYKEIFYGGPLTESEAFSKTDASRVGHHNNCFLSGENDGDTYMSKTWQPPQHESHYCDGQVDEIQCWKDFIAQEGRFTPVGGETCRFNPPRTDCPNALAELEMLHWSFMYDGYNQEVLDGWKAGGCWDEVRRRLGYRFALTRLTVSTQVSAGGTMSFHLELENEGFASPFNERPVILVLKRDSDGYQKLVPLESADPRWWMPGQTINVDAEVPIPADLPEGAYSLYLWLPDASPSLRDRPEYAIRMANENVWQSTTGYSLLYNNLQVTSPGPTPGGPSLETGTVSGVGSSQWTLVTLPRSYSSMVVVASANYDNTSPPGVVRIRNTAGNSFEVRVDAADGTSTLSGLDVHYLVVEEGVYTEAEHGVTMEAVRFTSTLTDRRHSWMGEERGYANAYSSPVVVGQVMTYNDPDWSAFWARGAASYEPPSSTALYVGKHVGEDPDRTRAQEMIGYIVIEAGSGTMDGTEYLAGLGADTVQGMGNSPPYIYPLSGVAAGSRAVVSQAGTNGGNGGWAVLYGAEPVPAGGLALAIDEDQMADAERMHATEQMAYLVFQTALGPAGMRTVAGPAAMPTRTSTPSATPEPMPTPSDTPMAAPSETATPSDTVTPTETPWNTPWPTETPTSSPTSTQIPTDTPMPTASPTGTPMPSNTATPTGAPTDTPLPTATPAGAPMPSNTATPTEAPTDTLLPTATPTGTPMPPNTAMPTGRPTDTPTPGGTPTRTSE